MKLDDEHLLSACRDNDPQALRQLYDDYAPAMLGLCMRYVKDRDAAQDVLHDGFIKVFENISSLRKPEMLGSWIRSIMIRTAIDSLRQSRKHTLVDDSDMDSLCNDDSTDLPYDAEQIVSALEQLPDTMRVVFNLYFIEGYSAQDLAEEYNLQPSSIRSICHRARKALLEILNNKNPKHE